MTLAPSGLAAGSAVGLGGGLAGFFLAVRMCVRVVCLFYFPRVLCCLSRPFFFFFF
ncbi:hypothetical protein B0T19DRAFT_434006 [Cercophora scortea]|uniref:Uncharacterized protein n=1 Tax=Cercophora scortea TaxID=314031 RepID=A0AAE0M5H5_9PEZI|nr:hypothetical protein B0T19DRAFT_434006 [Cercophora scortea]